ncbi:MAG: SIR2 family NAD-dependent protein deacylase [Spirochaetota bacterium]
MKEEIALAAQLMERSACTVAFTGAGISVESGIPPFRGADGLWAKYDPVFIEISYFYQHPTESWKKIREVFYDCIGKAMPNPAHRALAELEEMGRLHAVITQNIDGLHQKAGSRTVHEFHGTTTTLSCGKCSARYAATQERLRVIPPVCDECGRILKPDFIFFGEMIDPEVIEKSMTAGENASVMLVIGTTGEVMPACRIPFLAKQNGAYIIEINPEESALTPDITDIFIRMNASEAMSRLKSDVETLIQKDCT